MTTTAPPVSLVEIEQQCNRVASVIYGYRNECGFVEWEDVQEKLDALRELLSRGAGPSLGVRPDGASSRRRCREARGVSADP